MAQFNSKIGDVYKTKETRIGVQYFQLVASDMANLNSDVVVFFDPTSDDETANLEQLAGSSIAFYTHTSVDAGVGSGGWLKVGNAPVVVDLAKLVFKLRNGEEVGDAYKATGITEGMPNLPYPNWSIWSPLSDGFQYVNDDDGKKVNAEEGNIFPPQDLISRLETGKTNAL